MNEIITLSERIEARCKPEEKEAIQKAADNSNRSVSDYIRLVMTGAVEEEKKV